MSFNYPKTAATAKRLLDRFGQPVMLTRTTPGTYAPATGTATDTTATHTGIGAKLDYAQRDIDGTLIKVGDCRVYIAPDLTVTPQTGDKITIGSETWNVITSRPLEPAGVVVLHDVQVRKQ